MRTGDLELLREKRAIKVMEAQSQLPGHILEAAETVAAAGVVAVMVGQSPGSCCSARGGVSVPEADRGGRQPHGHDSPAAAALCCPRPAAALPPPDRLTD